MHPQETLVSSSTGAGYVAIDRAPAARFARRLVALVESGYGLEQRLDSPREFLAPARDRTALYLQEIGSPASEK